MPSRRTLERRDRLLGPVLKEPDLSRWPDKIRQVSEMDDDERERACFVVVSGKVDGRMTRRVVACYSTPDKDANRQFAATNMAAIAEMAGRRDWVMRVYVKVWDGKGKITPNNRNSGWVSIHKIEVNCP